MSPTNFLKPERIVQPLRREVGLADLEEHRSHIRGGERREHVPNQRSTDAAAPHRQGDTEVQNLSFVEHASRDDVPHRTVARHGHEDEQAGRDAVREVDAGPRIGEGDSLQRDQRGNVSLPCGTDPEGCVRGAPPSGPALRQGAHSLAPP